MTLKKVRVLNYDRDYAYAPPADDAVINTDEIQSIVPVETRRSERCVSVRFRDGKTLTCIGVPDDFIDTSTETDNQ